MAKKRQRSNPFQKALSASEAALKAKLKEREAALDSLSSLNHEIPALQETVRALQQQISGKPGPVPAPKPAAGTGEIPPEVMAMLPPDDMSNFGSIPAPVQHVEQPSGSPMKFDDEGLPEIEGQPMTKDS